MFLNIMTTMQGVTVRHHFCGQGREKRMYFYIKTLLQLWAVYDFIRDAPYLIAIMVATVAHATTKL